MAEFGTVFYHEMPLIEFRNGAWSAIQWQSSAEIRLSPAAHCLHYGSTCFEGQKAYRQADGGVAVYRLKDHIARLHHSAQGLFLPPVDAHLFEEMVLELVRRAKDEIPAFPGSLYIRPLLIGLDPKVGNATHPSESACFYVLASPVGDYFTPGAKMKIYVDETNMRCAPHMGMLKTGGNYASALNWAIHAEKELGAQQVLFCPHGDVQETGAANFILIDPKKKRIVTKNLTSEFLHGVTRDSILQVGRDLGYDIDERAYTTRDLRQWVKEGYEAALTGTAAVLAPVSSLLFEDGEEVQVQGSEHAMKLRAALLDIQGGKAPDTHHWLTKI